LEEVEVEQDNGMAELLILQMLEVRVEEEVIPTELALVELLDKEMQEVMLMLI
jgi:hypothetical protein